MRLTFAAATPRKRWKTLLGLAGAVVALTLAVPIAGVPASAAASTTVNTNLWNQGGARYNCLSTNNEAIPGGPATSYKVYGVACSNSIYQTWGFNGDAPYDHVYTTITNRGTGRCLSANNSPYPGQPTTAHEVYTVACSSSAYQRWWPIIQDGSFILLNDGSGWCLSMNETPLPGSPANTKMVYTTASCSATVDYHLWLTLTY